jgi:hypothetical protein
MKIDRQNAAIELTQDEADVLLGQAKATTAMLADKHHPSGRYRSFREKVEHAAAELHHETDRTVEVFADGIDERIAVYKGGELIIEAG